ncbi:MAG: HD domain-containing protein, partial [Candidatus Buchananbacteria bacterium]
MGDHLTAEISEISNGIEVSPYVWQIIETPEVYQKLLLLLEREDVPSAEGHFESSYKHSIDLAKLAEAYAERIELASEDKEVLVTACLLHDIGKNEVPLEILLKNGKLLPKEREAINTHSV